MKQKICLMLLITLAFVIYGIVGAIENGASLWLALIAIPIYPTMFIIGKIGGVMYE